jgi:hypothetical protein
MHHYKNKNNFLLHHDPGSGGGHRTCWKEQLDSGGGQLTTAPLTKMGRFSDATA